MSNPKRIAQFISFFLLPLLLDRITKYCILHSLPDYQNAILSFDISFNRGVTWSLFYSESTVTFGVLTIFICIITSVLSWYTYKRYCLGYPVNAELLILSGAISNIIDRFVYHGVIDFIVLNFGFFVWPTFNIADMCIVLGVGMIVVMSLHEEKALS